MDRPVPVGQKLVEFQLAQAAGVGSLDRPNTRLQILLRDTVQLADDSLSLQVLAQDLFLEHTLDSQLLEDLLPEVESRAHIVVLHYQLHGRGSTAPPAYRYLVVLVGMLSRQIVDCQLGQCLLRPLLLGLTQLGCELLLVFL